jgi:hypothetical protein
MKKKLNSGNDCYHSVCSVLSSRLLSKKKNLRSKIYEIVILLVLLYGCETWPLTLREEHRLRVFENRVPKRIFGPKRETTGDWRRLRDEELHNLYSSANIISLIKSSWKNGWDMWHGWERCETHTKC